MGVIYLGTKNKQETYCLTQKYISKLETHSHLQMTCTSVHVSYLVCGSVKHTVNIKLFCRACDCIAFIHFNLQTTSICYFVIVYHNNTDQSSKMQEGM